MLNGTQVPACTVVHEPAFTPDAGLVASLAAAAPGLGRTALFHRESAAQFDVWAAERDRLGDYGQAARLRYFAKLDHAVAAALDAPAGRSAPAAALRNLMRVVDVLVELGRCDYGETLAAAMCAGRAALGEGV